MAVALAMVLLFVIGHLRSDLANDVVVWHDWVECVALVLACVGVLGTTVQLLSALSRARELQRDLRCTREDTERLRTENEAQLRRSGMAAEHHFLKWGLTCAEKEIALLVLRGLCYKEVASARGTSERTVRHQVLQIYRKAGVAGRAEMAAVFLRDVLPAAGIQAGAQLLPDVGSARSTSAS
jgi:DNA-binding CsgD family transcriptional regulator